MYLDKKGCAIMIKKGVVVKNLHLFSLAQRYPNVLKFGAFECLLHKKIPTALKKQLAFFFVCNNKFL
jgi:hypothetical protein